MSDAPPRRRSLLVSLLLLRSSPFTNKRLLYNFARFAVAGAYLYIAGVLVLVALEDRILYHPTTAVVYWKPPPPSLGAQDVEFASADGTRLHGWWITPPNWTPEQGALLYCHGKGDNVSMLSASALNWREQLNVAVLLYDYPGFGRSGGEPSEAGLYAAGDAAYDWLVNVQHVPAHRLLIHGQSLGGGVAVDLAARRPHRALILISTFTSFPEAAQAALRIVPALWLAHNQFRSVDKIPHITTPVFIAHGTADHTIPFSLGERLYAAVKSEHKRFLRVEDGTHNLMNDVRIPQAVHDFLESLSEPRP